MDEQKPAFHVREIPVYGDLILSPMDGFSDQPFRKICRDFGSAMSYTEFTSCDAILHNARMALKQLEVDRAVGGVDRDGGQAEPALEGALAEARRLHAAVRDDGPLLREQPVLRDDHLLADAPGVGVEADRRQPARLGRLAVRDDLGEVEAGPDRASTFSTSSHVP